MGRNFDVPNYRITRTSLIDSNKNEIKEFIKRGDAANYVNISASTLLRFIKSKKMKIYNNEIYLIERITLRY